MYLYLHSVLLSSDWDVGVHSRSSVAQARTRLVQPRAMDIMAVCAVIVSPIALNLPSTLLCLGFVGLHHPQISTTLVVHQSPPSLNCSYTSRIIAHILCFRIVARFSRFSRTSSRFSRASRASRVSRSPNHVAHFVHFPQSPGAWCLVPGS